MKTVRKLIGLTGVLFLSTAYSQVVVAPAVVAAPPPPVVVAPPPPPAVLVPPGVTYVAPFEVAPGPGYAWRYRVGTGWGWWHPRWGWHRTVIVHRWRRW